MIKLSKRDWEVMKRPVFPNIQFVSNKDSFQIQSMVKLEIDDMHYVMHVMLREKISEISELLEFLNEYIFKAQEIALKYKIDEEETSNLLYKIKDND